MSHRQSPLSALRPAAGRLLQRAMRSPLLPFEVRARLYWRVSQGTWIARRPADFAGKLRWKILKDRRPLQTMFADRIAVREYVARAAGSQYLTECYAIATDPATINRATLPREFAAKVTHGSGGVWLVSELAPAGVTVITGPDARGPVWPGSGWNHVLTRPDEFDWELFDRTFRAWLSRNLSRSHYVEWAYLHVPPRMIVEELLRPDGGIVPNDYKFFVFNGRPRLIHVVTGRFLGPEHIRSNLYLPDWTPVDADWPDGPTIYPRAPVMDPPPSLGEMIDVATSLGHDTDFVRVDLYDIGGRVVFGELTNTPGAGSAGFKPRSFDAEVGSWWELPARCGR